MDNLYQQIKHKIKWITEIAKRRKWDVIQELVIERPATKSEIEEVEKEIGFRLPSDYKRLLFEFSRRVAFSYQFEEQVSEEFIEIFSVELSWDIDQIKEQYDDYLGWVEAWLDPENAVDSDEEFLKNQEVIVKNKMPFMEVANGDLIVIGEPEVIYFDHEGDTMHGKRLGKNLFDFLDRWSQIGFIGSEGWQIEQLYDFEKNEIMPLNNPKVQRWLDWLNQK